MWVDSMDGSLIRRCAHCLVPFGRHEVMDTALLARQAAASAAQHAQHCVARQLRRTA